jgi:hypothetical protein
MKRLSVFMWVFLLLPISLLGCPTDEGGNDDAKLSEKKDQHLVETKKKFHRHSYVILYGS